MASTPIIESAFDPVLYLRCNPDVAEAGLDPKEHWLEFGREQERKGLRPSWLAPSFAEEDYLDHYPDVADLVALGDYASGAEHWFVTGRAEVRNGSRKPFPEFDEADYLARRLDVAAEVAAGSYISGFDHWLIWGSREDHIHKSRLESLIRRAVETPVASFTSSTYSDSISQEKAAFWNENGYLILEGVISPERCEAINRRIDRLWVERRANAPGNSIAVFLERADSRRMLMRDAPGEARSLPYKINDMAMFDSGICSLALDDDVAEVLRWILRSDPVVIGSLNFERGSTQRFHTDTLYVPGKTEGGMAAAWFALEDVTEEAGPLLYYPGSHKIPLFRFSSGLPNQINEEIADYDTFMSWNAASLKLMPKAFLPKQGDVLIWHERLYHGGAAIKDLAQTRKSLVCHYWRANEMPADELVAKGKGYYWNRPPLI